MEIVEAAHIKPYAEEPDDDPANGLLLRADLHTLFDLHLIGIEPNTLTLSVHPAAKAAGYAAYQGLPLRCSENKPNPELLQERWELFQRRLQMKGN